MSRMIKRSRWNQTDPLPVCAERRLEFVRSCSLFASGLLDRHPDWADALDEHRPPLATELAVETGAWGLEAGLRRFRNRNLLRIIWRDLCNLALLDETFSDLTLLAELCLSAAIDGNAILLQKQFGVPVDKHGREQFLVVLGLGKLGGVELNLSSDIDLIFCYDSSGECQGESKHRLSNEQYFTRLARAVIASLSDMTEEGFCFRVDTRLRPFGDSGPLCTSLAAMEQYYQREGRDWERYALIKARPVAGDMKLGKQLMDQIRPFVYRRYVDFTAVEALQDMHGQVKEDASRKGRLDDIKRGPGGIREIEFLAQCFQLLRGGREPALQTPSLSQALATIEERGLLDQQTVRAIYADYVFLRRLENRIQALRDQQTHSIPVGEDLLRLTRAMNAPDAASLKQQLQMVRDNVTRRFQSIFPSQPERAADPKWIEVWGQIQIDRQAASATAEGPEDQPLAIFLRNLGRMALSQRAHRRLDQFMPVLLHRLDRLELEQQTLHRVFDLVLTICQRSPYLVLLVQNAPALDRLIDLFARSEWIATSVIRFPALLDELIDPSLGHQIPGAEELQLSVKRLMKAAQETELVLNGLNYLKLATSLRIAVAQLNGTLDCTAAQSALASLAAALLQGTLALATAEIEARHGCIVPSSEDTHDPNNSLAIIAYGSLGAVETNYDSDLDLVFLFSSLDGMSTGKRSLPAERYYARLAQRILGFLTVMTPTGRLYPVDTRLRPNGRAGALVSSLDAFADYQMKQAWTWELQALTRARFVAGNSVTAQRFLRIRERALARQRDLTQIREALSEMRGRMVQEQSVSEQSGQQLKHQPGGLIDIAFVAQFGVLATAATHSLVLKTTNTIEQLQALSEFGWLSPADAINLEQTVRALHQQRMLSTLVAGGAYTQINTSAAAEAFRRFLDSAGVGDPPSLVG